MIPPEFSQSVKVSILMVRMTDFIDRVYVVQSHMSTRHARSIISDSSVNGVLRCARFECPNFFEPYGDIDDQTCDFPGQ